MKIGVYDPYLDYDSLGGGERYMLTLASCLSKNNQVAIFFDEKDILAKAEERFGLDLSAVTVSENVFSPEVKFFQKIAQTKKYDKIFFLSDGSIPISFAKKTFLLFQHPMEWVHGKTLMNKLKLKKIDKIICNSEYTKSFIDRTYAVDSSVLYPPCGHTEESVADIDKKENIILTVGRFNMLPNGKDFKKHHFLIKMFKSMVTNGLQGWKFVIVTSFLKEEEMYVDELEKSAAGFPITIAKNKGSNEVKKYYTDAKIYWHAAGYGEDLDEHPERAEHFGISTVEAMHYGAVPVVIDAGGQKEIVEDRVNGLLWRTDQELVAATELIMDDDALRKNLVKGAIERTKQFSNEKFCQSLHKIIQ